RRVHEDANGQKWLNDGKNYLRALSSAWLEHLPYKQGVGGSSPSAPMRGMKAPPGFSDPGGAFAVAIPASILPAFHAARSGQKLSAWSRCWSVHQRSP